ncbi:MAG TPA: YbjN domain-containing protein [Cyclobacteriaceae bacterium]|nr:YbjN domain-containing protein [Cyclobacteriaceae bacterium]
MDANFAKVREYLQDLDYMIVRQNPAEGVFVVEKEDAGIKNLMIGCTDPILVMEQFICEIAKPSAETLKNLLIKNRDIIHGGFVLDKSGKNLLFRDTLELENLDLNELAGSLNSLSLLMSEYSEELIKMSKN